MQAELHQLQRAHEKLKQELKTAKEDVIVLRELNNRGDATLRQAQAALEASKDASVSACHSNMQRRAQQA